MLHYHQQMATVFIVDDIPTFLRETRSILNGHFKVATCRDPLRAVGRILQENPEVVLTTLVMKNLDGLELIRILRSRGYEGIIVMATRFGDASTAIEATRLGAADFIVRPYHGEELISRIRRTLERIEDVANSPSPDDFEDGVCTTDPEMLALLERARIAAEAESRVLILGETGTGKELIARAIHRRSPRSDQPFVVVNCAAIQENLLESELFGHERGSFTGANERRIGRFEQAGEGTLFLDEIGEMPLPIQAKLLRTLQGGDFSRVGGNQTLHSRARIVAATNQDLRERVDRGLFRTDLYFRLNVIALTLPPLRKRPGDIRHLADFFFRRFQKPGTPPQRFSENALRILCSYAWPGNVREVEHLIERLSILCKKPLIEESDLPAHLREANMASLPSGASGEGKDLPPFVDAKRQFETEYFSNVMAVANGNYSEAARIAGVERTAFFRKARRVLSD